MASNGHMQASTPYWAAVAAVEKTLQPQRIINGEQIFYVTSIENVLKRITGGRIFEADRRNSAMRIVEGSHRLSTEEEVAQYQIDSQARADTCRLIEEKRKTQGALLRVDRAELKRLGELQ